MEQPELVRKVFYAMGKAAGVSEKEISESWTKCSAEDMKMIEEITESLKEIFKEKHVT